MIAVERQAQAQLVGYDRQVEEAINAKAGSAAFGGGGIRRKAGVDFVEFGLVGDVADRPAHRIGAEQRALRPGQHFDAVEVGGVDIKIAARSGGGRIVDVERDVGLHARNAQNLCAGRVGRQTADID